MIPMSYVLLVFLVLVNACIGTALGVTLGSVVAVVLRTGFRGVLLDGALGAIGFLAGLAACVIVPWPRNTVTYSSGGTTWTSTMNSYQHPYLVASVIACFLALLHEFYRYSRKTMH